MSGYPKKIKRLAIVSAFSQKAKDDAIRVLENFDLDAPKTKRMAQMTQHLQVSDRKALLVTSDVSENVVKSCRNLSHLRILPVNQVSTYDLVQAEALILTTGAVDRIQALWGAA